MQTVWVLGDQLNQSIGALSRADPHTHRVLLVESAALLGSRRWHRQRAHLVIASMRRFADELRGAGFEVDHRRAPSLLDGLHAHLDERSPDGVAVTEPNSWDLRRRAEQLDIEIVRSNQFLCHYDDFAGWAQSRKQRTGDDACPYTTLYWDFLARHAERFGKNPRMARQVSAMRRLGDLDAVRERAAELLDRLDRGAL